MPYQVPRKGAPASPTGAASGVSGTTGASPAASREKMMPAPSSDRYRLPSPFSVPTMVSISATPSDTIHAAVSFSSPSNSSAVPSSFNVSTMVMPKSDSAYTSPPISMEMPYQVPRKGAPASPTGAATIGSGSGSGASMGSLRTASSSASTSGRSAGSVMHCACGKASLPSVFSRLYSFIETALPRYTVCRLVQPSKTHRSSWCTPFTNTTSRRLVQPENTPSESVSRGA